MRLLTVLVTAFAVASVTAVSAASELPRDLSVSYLFSGPGHMTKLASGATYQASEFPIALRMTTPNGSCSVGPLSARVVQTRRSPRKDSS